MEQKKAVLEKIARAFEREGVTWALGGSMLLYFKGLVNACEDIDLMVTLEDAPRAQQVLCEMGEFAPVPPHPKFATKFFLRGAVDGVGVDVMAGFAVVTQEGVKDCSLKAEEIEEMRPLGGTLIALHALSNWQDYYAWMGRDAKAERIAHWRKAHPED